MKTKDCYCSWKEQRHPDDKRGQIRIASFETIEDMNEFLAELEQRPDFLGVMTIEWGYVDIKRAKTDLNLMLREMQPPRQTDKVGTGDLSSSL